MFLYVFHLIIIGLLVLSVLMQSSSSDGIMGIGGNRNPDISRYIMPKHEASIMSNLTMIFGALFFISTFALSSKHMHDYKSMPSFADKVAQSVNLPLSNSDPLKQRNQSASTASQDHSYGQNTNTTSTTDKGNQTTNISENKAENNKNVIDVKNINISKDKEINKVNSNETSSQKQNDTTLTQSNNHDATGNGKDSGPADYEINLKEQQNKVMNIDNK